MSYINVPDDVWENILELVKELKSWHCTTPLCSICYLLSQLPHELHNAADDHETTLP